MGTSPSYGILENNEQRLIWGFNWFHFSLFGRGYLCSSWSGVRMFITTALLQVVPEKAMWTHGVRNALWWQSLLCTHSYRWHFEANPRRLGEAKNLACAELFDSRQQDFEGAKKLQNQMWGFDGWQESLTVIVFHIYVYWRRATLSRFEFRLVVDIVFIFMVSCCCKHSNETEVQSHWK